MFSPIIMAMNTFPELQRSFHASVDTLLAAMPRMDLTSVTAPVHEANVSLSPAKADVKRIMGQMPRRCHAC
jgi:hypothetical protein